MNKNQAEIIWTNCLSYIKDNIQEEQAFNTWFTPIKAIKYKENVLTLQVPSKFFYEWLEEHYIKLLKSAITKHLGKEAKLVYSVVMEKGNANNKEPYTVNISSSNRSTVQDKQKLNTPNAQLAQVKNPFVIPGLQKITINSQLKSDYTFENFLEGDCNRLARSAGLAIAERPGGTSFNPLFIHGGVGLGKTHLANSIGLKTKELDSSKTVLYISTEKFTQQFISAVKNNNRNDFVHFYQMIDVLIVDDIQFLSGKRATQDVFFHIFNHLHQRGKQLIITSDKSPADLQEIEKRLISRFKWGLSADLQKPDLETRKAILEHKLAQDGVALEEEIVDYIADSVKNNVREIEGALISLLAQSSLNKKNITLELAKKTLTNFVSHSSKEISIDYIQKVVSDYFKVPIELIQSKTRKRDVVQARQLAMYFSKQFTNASLASIGKKIGKRDHATVLHACKTVKNFAEVDKVYKGYLEDIEKRIQSN